MTLARSVVLDNEAVHALSDPSHRKHRRVLSLVDGFASRRRVRPDGFRLIVPTAVRVEAGWGRRAQRAAVINRLPIADMSLDTRIADIGASILVAIGVSVTDAHIGAVLSFAPEPHVVLTSDPRYIRKVAAYLGLEPRIVAI